MNKQRVFWLGILGTLFFVVPAIIGGFQFEEYSHLSQFLSETYAIGTPYGNQLRFFAYLPSGIFLTLFALYAPQYLPKSKFITIAFRLFAIFYGLGTIIVSIFPCDAGCNRELIDPSISQIIHNISGALIYIIIPLVLIFIGIKAKSWSNSNSYARLTLFFGITALVFSWLMMSDPNENLIGLYQRLVEGSFLSWVVLTAFHIKNNKIV